MIMCESGDVQYPKPANHKATAVRNGDQVAKNDGSKHVSAKRLYYHKC